MAKGSFAVDIDKFIDELVPEQILLLTRGVSLQVLTGVIEMTPVDTGRARGNWITSVAAPISSPIDRLDKSGDATKAAGSDVIGSMSVPEIVYVQNNLPYIEYLEGGSSTQAPLGMVAVTVANVEASFK